jgi:hypothetical protein
MRRTCYWGFELGLAEVLAIGLAAGFAVDLAIGFAVDLAIGFAAVAALALAFGLGLGPVAAIAVPVIKKPEATKAARSFFKKITSFRSVSNGRGFERAGRRPSTWLLPLADESSRDD